MKNTINWIDILSFMLFALAVFFILTRIFGHSATDLTISITLFSAVGMLLYKLNREFGEFKVKITGDIAVIKENINELKLRIDKIDSKLDKLLNKNGI